MVTDGQTEDAWTRRREDLLMLSMLITSLQVPHRLADAILRDSEIAEGPEGPDGKKGKISFRKSSKGKALNTVSQQNATALYQLCPTALIFGMWDSTGPKGGLGAKFERAMVSEVVGVGATVGDLVRGVRRDPLEIRAAVKVLKPGDKNWSLAAANANSAVSPSEVNHSSVPFPKQRDEKTDKNLYAGTAQPLNTPNNLDDSPSLLSVGYVSQPQTRPRLKLTQPVARFSRRLDSAQPRLLLNQGWASARDVCFGRRRRCVGNCSKSRVTLQRSFR